MVYIEVWSKILIFVAFVSILTIYICQVKACFSIFFYKSIISKVKSGITPIYIITCREILERSTFDRKSLLKLVLSSILRNIKYMLNSYI